MRPDIDFWSSCFIIFRNLTFTFLHRCCLITIVTVCYWHQSPMMCISLEGKLLYADVSGSQEFLGQLERHRQQSFPAITLKKGSRLNVCGETLERCDLETLLGSTWLNDKVCLFYIALFRNKCRITKKEKITKRNKHTYIRKPLKWNVNINFCACYLAL